MKLRSVPQLLHSLRHHVKWLQTPIMLRCQPGYSDEPSAWQQLLADTDKLLAVIRQAQASFVELQALDAKLLADTPGLEPWERALLSEEHAGPAYALFEEVGKRHDELNITYLSLLKGTYVAQAA